jgi:hypothetical protein
VAVALCLLAAGAAVILTAGASALRGQLIRQAGGQLQSYAYQLAGQSFQLLGTSQSAPATIVPFDGLGTGGQARAPGTADRVGAAGPASTPSATRAKGAMAATGVSSASVAIVGVFTGPPGFSIELRGPGGQLLVSAGPGTRPGLALPKPFAPVPARTGVLRTVAGVGGSYLVIAEPVRFTARRLVFAYGANDFAITGGARTSQPGQSGRAGQAGQAGTLVVGMRLARIYQPAGRLILLAVAVSAAAIVIVGGLAWAAIRLILRPVTRAARTADAGAAGMTGNGSGLVNPVAEQQAGDLAGSAGGLAAGLAGSAAGLAGSLNTSLSELDSQFTTSVHAEAAARAATEQLAARLESVAGALRRPISLLHGRAEHWAHGDGRRNGDPDRALTQIEAQVAGAEAVLDELDDARG